MQEVLDAARHHDHAVQVAGRGKEVGEDERRLAWIRRPQPDLADALASQKNRADGKALGGRMSAAFAINELGQVVGRSETAAGVEHAFLWEDGTMHDLNVLGAADLKSQAADINIRGQAVGFVWTADRSIASLWEGGTMWDLGNLGSGATADAVNVWGQVVGYSGVAGLGSVHAFRWSERAGMVDLGTLGGRDSSADGINNWGQIVGYSDLPTGARHAFLWSGGRLQDLGTLGAGFAGSDASAVNDWGQIVGLSSVSPNPWLDLGLPRHAFLWTKRGGMVDLGTLGGIYSIAYDLNERGHIVGASTTPSGDTHAVLWTLQDAWQFGNAVAFSP